MSLIITKMAHISDIKVSREIADFTEAKTSSNTRRIPTLEV